MSNSKQIFGSHAVAAGNTLPAQGNFKSCEPRFLIVLLSAHAG